MIFSENDRVGQVQLAAYRLAWARSLPACRSTTYGPAFHYVRDAITVRPADLLDADGLAVLVAGLPEAASPA